MTLSKEEQLYKSYVVPGFSDLMVKALAEHGDRGDSWKDEDEGWLLERAREELEELAISLEKRDTKGMGYSQKQAKVIAHNAADVSNFMMMIADAVGGL